MLTWLASLIGGPIVNGLIEGYKAKLDAANIRAAILTCCSPRPSPRASWSGPMRLQRPLKSSWWWAHSCSQWPT